MRAVRHEAVENARRSIGAFATPDAHANLTPASDSSASSLNAPLWGVVLGTLGRQGSFRQLQAITHQLSSSRTPIPYMPILLSELSPAKLALFNPHISTFVQTSCPRLSIDWGYAFDKPLLSPYETAVAVGKAIGWVEETETGKKESVYPMDFYAAGTPWSVARTKAVY
jgi:2-(3-amino-3-carboxypropyl)histidine synthase